MSSQNYETHRLGEQLERLSIANGRRNEADGSISAIVGRAGHIFFGPYLAVPPGPYSIRMIFVADPVRAADSGLVLEAALGEKSIASIPLDEAAIEAGMVAFQFLVPSQEAVGDEDVKAPKLEVRLHSRGETSITAASVDLRQMNPALGARLQTGPQGGARP
jgi:hypothetical protein